MVGQNTMVIQQNTITIRQNTMASQNIMASQQNTMTSQQNTMASQQNIMTSQQNTMTILTALIRICQLRSKMLFLLLAFRSAEVCLDLVYGNIKNLHARKSLLLLHIARVDHFRGGSIKLFLHRHTATAATAVALMVRYGPRWLCSVRTAGP